MLAWHEAEPRAELPRALEVVAVPNRGHYRRGRRRANTKQLHHPTSMFILLGSFPDVAVILVDALVKARQVTEQIANDRVAAAWQPFENLVHAATQGSGPLWQDDAQLTK
jgi:hypothetical protein